MLVLKKEANNLTNGEIKLKFERSKTVKDIVTTPDLTQAKRSSNSKIFTALTVHWGDWHLI